PCGPCLRGVFAGPAGPGQSQGRCLWLSPWLIDLHRVAAGSATIRDMKRLVASEARVTLTAGIVAGSIIAFTDPGPDVAFLIAVGIAAVGLAFILGPER